MSFNIVIIGATGNVGCALMSLLVERNFPIDKVIITASQSSVGKVVMFGQQQLVVQPLNEIDFAPVDIIFSVASSEVSALCAPRAALQCVVIDEAATFRLDPLVPLIVPEVNAALIADFQRRSIIASPNCVVIPLVMILDSLRRAGKITRIVVTTYQAVSGAGKAAMDELRSGDSTRQSVFSRDIAFNVIPQIGTLDQAGHSSEELKIIAEVNKILGLTNLTVTCVRVPVFVGHSFTMNVEFAQEVSQKEVYQVLGSTLGIVHCDVGDRHKYVTPLEASGKDQVFVSRVRSDQSSRRAINLWATCDNLRKGAALNVVQIAEALIKDYLHPKQGNDSQLRS